MLTILFISCKKDTKEAATKEENTNQATIAISSKNLDSYLKFDPELVEYDITGLDKAEKFSSTALSFPIKENDFDYAKSTDFDYFTAKSFEIAANTFKIILFNTYGENDAKILNIQLNSYNGGKLVDALLLDCRFTFETEYYRNFKIDGNTIEIKKISVDKLDFNDNGDIIGNKKVNDTLTEVVKYQINDKGLFIKKQ